MSKKMTEEDARNYLQNALDTIKPTIHELGLTCVNDVTEAEDGIDGWANHGYLKLFSVKLAGLNRKKYDVEIWIDNIYSKGRFAISLSLNASVVKKDLVKGLIKNCIEINGVDRKLKSGEMYYENYKDSEEINNERYISIYCNKVSELPDQFLTFYEKVIVLVQEDANTTRQALIQARDGQGKFRSDVLINCDNKCCVTGCEIPFLLRASHVKPWKNSNDRERLDYNNGLMLIGTLDLAFDKGLISFHDNGRIIISDRYLEQLRSIGIDSSLGIINSNLISSIMKEYLSYHRENIFDKIDK